MRQPPRFATMLLQRLAPTERILAGDLQEEFQVRSSRTWYWGQVLAAVAVTIRRELFSHPWVVLTSVMVGAAVTLAFLASVGIVLTEVIRHYGFRAIVFLTLHRLPDEVVRLLISAWTGSMAYFPMICAAYFCAGWVVARLHGHHASLAIVSFGVVVWLALFAVSEKLHGWTVVTPPLRFALISATGWQFHHTGLLLVPVSILAGGLFGLKTRDQSVSPTSS